jgi:parallel beta-helix repeat protein
MDLIVLFIIVSIVVFVVVNWNLLIPLQGAQNNEIVEYIKHVFRHDYDNNIFLQQYINKPIVTPIEETILDLNNNTEHKLEKYNLGPQIHNYGKWYNVTLTFYLEYGNNQYLSDLLDLLYEYKIHKAVFFIDKTYAKENPVKIMTIKYDGYLVRDWKVTGKYDNDYYPTIFDGIILQDKLILNKTKSDYDAASFLESATHYYDSSIIVFSPKIMLHKEVLEKLLRHNMKDTIFSDSNMTAVQNILNESMGKFYTSEITDPILIYLNFTKGNETKINPGYWTMNSIVEQYPNAVRFLPEKNAFLVTHSIVIGKNAQLSLINQKVLLLSAQNSQTPTATLIVSGGIVKTGNTTISSYDPFINGPDTNGFHPRSFLLVTNGGKMDVLNSKLSYLGYSLGGFENTTFKRAAINYYNSADVNILNSVLSHNFVSFYSRNTTDIRIVNNEIFDNINYGLDPHSYTRNIYVSGNHIYDNGLQGFICSLRCLNVTVTNNLVEHNGDGIGIHWLTNSSVIKDNIVRYNSKFGIFIEKSSFDNTVTNNTIISNKVGIGLLQNSTGNKVVQNILINNVLQPIKIDPDSQQNMVEDNPIYSLGNISGLPSAVKSLVSEILDIMIKND